MNARTKILVLALVQVGTIVAWAGHHERLWWSAPTFRIALNPIDPYDVLRGRYFILNPRGTTIGTGAAANQAPLPAAALGSFLGNEDHYGGRAQVAFCPVGAIRRICGLARPGAARPPLPQAVWSAGNLTLWRERRSAETPTFSGSVDLGLDRFFLPNGAPLPAAESAQGWELEVIFRPGLPLLPKRLWFGGKPVELR